MYTGVNHDGSTFDAYGLEGSVQAAIVKWHPKISHIIDTNGNIVWKRK